MTAVSLSLQFIGAGLIALGLLATLAGIFSLLFRGRVRTRVSPLMSVPGLIALVAGFWLMQTAAQ